MAKDGVPDAGSTPAVRAAYKIQQMREVRAAMMDAVQACKDAPGHIEAGEITGLSDEQVKALLRDRRDARRDIATTAKSLASLYQVIMRALLEECKSLSCDVAASDQGGKSDRRKRLEREKLRAAGMPDEDETAEEA